MRKLAISWWSTLSSLDKTQVCDTNEEIIGVSRRWETLTGREIELLYKSVHNISVVEDTRTLMDKIRDLKSDASVPKEVINNIIKYCEDNQIYDKLSNYGDFYYKLKNLM